MTDIRVEPRTPPTWPWLAAGVSVLIALVWWGLAGTRDVSEELSGTTATISPVATAGRASTPPAVGAFLTFAEATDAERGPEHTYTAAGIRKLTAALAAVIGNEAEFRDQFESFGKRADTLQADPHALNHSAQAREVFTATASLMAHIQQTRAGGATELRDQIAKVREAAEAVDDDRRLLDQTAQVEHFFRTAADALRELNQELGDKA